MRIVRWIPQTVRVRNNGWPRWMCFTGEPETVGSSVAGRGGRRKRARRRSAERYLDLVTAERLRGSLPRHAKREVRAWLGRGVAG